MASEIDICNIALIRLGADTIRSFDENNKRSRTCEILYKHVRDYFIEQYEWSFTTKYSQLALLADISHPQFEFVYQLPSDCAYPRQIVNSIGQIKSLIKWEVFETKVATDLEDAWLRYSVRLTNSGIYPIYFVEAISSQLAVELSPSIVQDKKVYDKLFAIADVKLKSALQADVNKGVEDIHRDQDAFNDSFVNP